MKLLERIAEELPQFQRMRECMSGPGAPVLVIGPSEIHKAHLIYASSAETEGNTLVILPDETAAGTLVQNINAMAGADLAVLYPARDFTLRHGETPSREFEHLRLSVLARIQSGEKSVVCASVEAALQCTIPPDSLRRRTFSIYEGQSCPTDWIAARLLQAGYERRPQVEGTAQFCVRGGIVDFYPPNLPAPVRIEMWGDEIDIMAHFDLESQRRTERLKKVTIVPAGEVQYDDREKFCGDLAALCKKIKLESARDLLKADLALLEGGAEPSSLDKYLTLCYAESATLFDYLPDAEMFVSEYANCREREKNDSWQKQEDQKRLLEEGELVRPLMHFEEGMPYLTLQASRRPAAFLDTFARTNQDIRFGELISMNPIQTSSFSGDLKLLKEDVAPLLSQGYAVIVLAGTAKAATALAHDLKSISLPAEYIKDSDSIAYRKIVVLAGELSGGFEYPELKVSLITTGRPGEHRVRRERFRKGKQLQSLNDLRPGDLVVHVSHGIGVFEGIHKLEMQGIVKDYIKISYAGSDTLYVPVTQLDLVSKYVGARDDGHVKLNSLHTAEWQKTRARAKKAVEDMAEELIALYAERMAAPGFAFSEDTEWQKDFEQHFPYVETDDQLRCVEEIKADMERPHPMDRVLCGDVGFGKTEVAMRACFKAVMDGKQCAILCPTTILAWQHYQTLIRRFDGFPVNVEVLSRFRTPKQQKEILKKLERGEVDIVVGTHRLVQKDVKFKDLGLAVVDEEQRFGVRHKEKFKEMFKSVDMLTLSATPIPRTLNMAISGIRDMSTIEQAPQDRYPVQSYVLEYDPGIIADAIRRELRRGGQVYYIHNRIESIELCASRIQSALPDARIAVAHGQMEEKELSEIWRQLLEHEIDILVCTTIIETGVDVANCNTLIIENADRMGLSQLYQLRGRVGRSSRRAFAYFTFTRGRVLSEIASKRLSAIREFTKFGSGFQIAMRDLEIRGAGNILGAKQHGHMEAVGYDLYLRLLSEAVARKKGEPVPERTHECQIDLRLDAHIPENYIAEPSQRIDIYKKIAAIQNEEDSYDVTDELIDRFGDPPAAVLSLLDVALLRNTLAGFGFEEINERPQGLLLYPMKLEMETAGKLKDAFGPRLVIGAGKRPYFLIKPRRQSAGQDVIETLRGVAAALSAASVREE